MRGTHRNACTFLASAALAGLATWATVAHAFASYPASACAVMCGSAGCSPPTTAAVHSDFAGQLQNHDTLFASVIVGCPVASTGSDPMFSSTSGGTVFGWANANASFAAACRTFAGGGGFGGSCGAITGTGFSHNFSVSPDPSAWHAGSSADGYYLQVWLGKKDSTGSTAGIFSYFVHP